MQKSFLFKFYGFLLLAAAVVLLGFTKLPSGELEVSVLAVGQGDAILIRTPANQKILVDAGPGAAVLAPLSQELGFFERKINLAVLTHPDTDHIAGFTEVLRRFEVEKILLTGVRHETEWYAEILRQIASQRIPTVLANAETDLDFGGGVLLDIVWPRNSLVDKTPADSNAASIVGRLIFGETALLLTGDLDTASEAELLQASPNLHAQVLKLGHHGAKTSSSEEFLAAVGSEIALVSAGADNQFSHPSEEILANVAGQRILETAERGTIKLVSDGREWRVLE